MSAKGFVGHNSLVEDYAERPENKTTEEMSLERYYIDTEAYMLPIDIFL